MPEDWAEDEAAGDVWDFYVPPHAVDTSRTAAAAAARRG